MRRTALGIFLILISLHILATIAQADEGMWPLYNIDKIPFDSLRTKGVTLTPQQVYNPAGGGIADAVVSVGATASFVSSDGLMITNHHVAYGAIQRQSTVDHNYIRDGFYADTREKEIPALGYTVNVTLSIEDVTVKVLKGVNEKMTDLERYQAIDKATKKIIAEAERGRDVKCDVSSMFGGRQYMLYTNFRIRDVRLVYAPPNAIGNYGDEDDNWIWPRHVGDFSFMRAYVAPDGKSAFYAKENVPYHPKVFLPISSKGIKEGEATFLIGYPGTTSRYTSSYNLEYLTDFYFPNYIRSDEDRLAIIATAMKADSVVAIRMASKIKGINNFYKKTKGIVIGLRRSDVIRKKKEIEKGLAAFIAADSIRTQKFGKVLPELDSLYHAHDKTRQRDFAFGTLMSGGDLIGMAASLHKWAIEREKPDIQRERGHQNRDTSSTREWLEDVQINLLPSVDKKLFRYALGQVTALPSDQRVAAVDKIFGTAKGPELDQLIDRFVDSLYANTKVGDLKTRIAMFGMSKTELEKLNDPFINFAASLRPELDRRELEDKTFSGARNRLDPRLIQAYAEWKNGNMYPEANGTKRINFGEVKGYAPYDAVTYNYQTSLTGIMEKETGVDPFIVPPELKQVYEKKDFGPYLDPVLKDVPVDFITTNSGTNGNSGSPILNGEGELIGLDFDTDFEGVAADYMYDPNLARAIVADIRYVLFVIDKVYHLDGLMKELTIH